MRRAWIAGAALLALINPLAALVPLIDTGGTEEGSDTCAQLLASARQLAREKAAAQRKP